MPRPAQLLRRTGAVIGLWGGLYALGYYQGQNEVLSTLNPVHFSPFRLQSRETLSSTSSIFTLKQTPARSWYSRINEFVVTTSGYQHWRSQLLERIRTTQESSIWSVQLKQPQLQIARAYTPLPPLNIGSIEDGERSEDIELRLLIRKEPGGEMSNYLHRLPEDATVEVRGPHVEVEIPEHTKEIIFLAGGTGIAPALQVAHIMSKRPDSRLAIMWANRRAEDCKGAPIEAGQSQKSRWLPTWLGGAAEPVAQEHNDNAEHGAIVRHLEHLSKSATTDRQIDTKYFLDERASYIRPEDVLEQVQQSLPNGSASGSKLILISGPDGFLDYWAGKKIWLDGREEQGPLRGALSQMELKGWSVWKL